MNSLGFVEVSGVVAAVDALDIMCKSADVTLVTWERKLGGRLVTLVVTGSVSAVTAAVENACAQCIKKPCASAVIANPHAETVKLVELSAKRLEKKAQAKEKAKPVKKTVKQTAKKTENAKVSDENAKKEN
ncbi:MAG: BMC domain-containing protein [Ruminococcaceae bacterium]|nr:BMC domain-containing protein [Oscillospiraceae bacterium]